MINKHILLKIYHRPVVPDIIEMPSTLNTHFPGKPTLLLLFKFAIDDENEPGSENEFFPSPLLKPAFTLHQANPGTETCFQRKSQLKYV
jgi:hypothetical protein